MVASMDPRSDEGSAMPLLALAMVVAVLMMLVSVEVSTRLVDEARAQAAADAAALAGAAAGPVAARQLAEANGAELIELTVERPGPIPDLNPNFQQSWGWFDGVVAVRVRIGDATATAAASTV